MRTRELMCVNICVCHSKLIPSFLTDLFCPPFPSLQALFIGTLKCCSWSHCSHFQPLLLPHSATTLTALLLCCKTWTLRCGQLCAKQEFSKTMWEFDFLSDRMDSLSSCQKCFSLKDSTQGWATWLEMYYNIRVSGQ